MANSTARITNGEKYQIRSVIVHVDEIQKDLGDLSPGESRFIFLPKSSDAAFKVSYLRGNNTISFCSEYVEGSMYHLDIDLKGLQDSRCLVSLPIVSELFVLKIM